MIVVVRFIAVLAASVLLVSGPALAAEQSNDAEAIFLDHINATRAEQGLPALVVNDELAGVALAWAHQMDADDDLHHNPSYTQQYTGEWRTMAENVGVMRWPGGSLEEIVASMHGAFVDSPGHYRNIVGDYNQVGVGVVRDGDELWVTVNFLRGPIPASTEGSPMAEGQQQRDEQPAPEPRNNYVRPGR